MLIKDELLYTVDENNIPLSPKPRDEVHMKGYWHRTSHIWVKTSEYAILCHQRSLAKDIYPGTWQPFFGGHLGPNVSYLDGARIELSEELGITVKNEDLTFVNTFKSETAKEFIGIYFYNWDGYIKQLNYEQEEIEQVKLFKVRELEKLLLAKNSQWSLAGYEKDFIKHIID